MFLPERELVSECQFRYSTSHKVYTVHVGFLVPYRGTIVVSVVTCHTTNQCNIKYYVHLYTSLHNSTIDHYKSWSRELFCSVRIG